MSFGQFVWPGDINRNGVVNNVDVLYFQLAKGTKGPDREDQSTTWTAHMPPDTWDETFPDGTEFHHADADGQGKIKNSDRRVITEENYGQTNGDVTPDNFLVGDPTTDPPMVMVPRKTSIEPGQTLKVDVFLGTADRPVTNMFGMAFTLNFTPHLVADCPDEFNPTEVKFKLQNGTWLDGSGSEAAKDFEVADNDAGELDVAVTRKQMGSASGYGEIGTFKIVMEDIVLSTEDTLELYIDDIKLIDTNLVEYPVASTMITVVVEANDPTMNSVAPEDQTDQHGTLTGRREGEGVPGADQAALTGAANDQEQGAAVDRNARAELLEATGHSKVIVYPNPVESEVWIESLAEDDEINRVMLFNNLGQLITSWTVGADQKVKVDTGNLNPGMYIVNVYTGSGTANYLITKK